MGSVCHHLCLQDDSIIHNKTFRFFNHILMMNKNTSELHSSTQMLYLPDHEVAEPPIIFSGTETVENLPHVVVRRVQLTH